MVSTELRQNLLFMEGVVKRYGPKTVLNGINLSVGAGEFCTLVGPSGCGKSTLFRLILGQERPSEGEMLFDGQPLGFPDESRGIVYQQYSLYPHLTVFQNVLLGRWLGMHPWQYWRQRRELRGEVEYHLEQVGLMKHAGKYPHELSGGQQQRVAIAQALIVRPRVLLMDEPFGALDASTRERLQVFLLELWQQFRMSIIFVTHDLIEAIFLGTRILVLSQFYSDDQGPAVDRGSKIVADYPSPWGKSVMPTDAKNDPAVQGLAQRILQDGFNPSHLQHVTEFNLRSRNSFPVETGR